MNVLRCVCMRNHGLFPGSSKRSSSSQKRPHLPPVQLAPVVYVALSEAVHPLPCGFKVKNAWIYFSIFSIRLHRVHTDNFTFFTALRVKEYGRLGCDVM